jgi:hypothetical protein
MKKASRMLKRFFSVWVALVLCIMVLGTTVNAEEGKKTAKSPYVGLWKLEKMMYQEGQEWKKPKYPFTLNILPNGKIVILMLPKPMIRITGTWKVLDDGRLQISEEEEDGKPFREGPSISIFSLQDGKLTKPPRPYLNQREKAQFGEILKKVEK